ncbi:class I SAM-dependent methyltransferase [Roseomonas sp. OT10]|uniref:SAM-dependent methyltransferase n=1 Tax=Roseomonas cutis TaxID=2897332 RepID=UPI001E512F62|nr:methyltransferase domain-containing protein [Roseomonas sp. OT10]UFN49024.1 class I SAM-dependent methyltransferase [Roseomonas sp. OT10]
MWRWLTAGRAKARQAEFAAWNTKVLGSVLARQAYEQGFAAQGSRGPAAPVPLGLTGRLCRQADLEAPWLHHWCDRQAILPLYHRKVWEDCFVLQALWEAGMLAPGRRGLGFAVGAEPLPAVMAAAGVEVLATDLSPRDPRARAWIRAEQHGSSLDTLYRPHLVDRATFDARVRHRDLDMRHVPAELDGQFDFVWSVCSFEHLGSIEAGLEFVRRAMRCLRPGGVAVHTTEFNLDDSGPGLERGPTVLFRRRHLESLFDRLARDGHDPLPMDWEAGDGVLDRFVDLPPYPLQKGWPLAIAPDAPHLKLAVHGCVATSAGLILRAGTER